MDTIAGVEDRGGGIEDAVTPATTCSPWGGPRAPDAGLTEESGDNESLSLMTGVSPCPVDSSIAENHQPQGELTADNL